MSKPHIDQKINEMLDSTDSLNKSIANYIPYDVTHGNITFTIDWVRHAESCSNYLSGNFLDKSTKTQQTGYNKNVLEEGWMEGGYLWGLFGKKIEENEINEDIMLSRTPSIISNVVQNVSSTSTNALSAIQSAFLLHPNLSYIGMQHASLFNRDYVIKNNLTYDIVLSSPTLRTIMTAMIGFRGSNNKKIYVVPYISEIQNPASYITTDYQNSALDTKTLKRMVLFIKKWLKAYWLNNYDDIYVIDLLKEIEETSKNENVKKCIKQYLVNLDNTKSFDNVKYPFMQLYNECLVKYVNDDIKIRRIQEIVENIEGPDVDFSILEYFENKYQDTTNTNFPKFYSEVLPYCFQENYLLIRVPYNYTICCVSHGLVMKNYFSKIYNKTPEHPMNTHTFRENITYQYNDYDKSYTVLHNNINFDQYVPLKVRETYENFEILNKNICESTSLLGFLNYNLFYETTLNNDISGYDQEIRDIYHPKDYNLVGGDRYYHKYLKYKKKYLELKQ